MWNLVPSEATTILTLGATSSFTRGIGPLGQRPGLGQAHHERQPEAPDSARRMISSTLDSALRRSDSAATQLDPGWSPRRTYGGAPGADEWEVARTAIGKLSIRSKPDGEDRDRSGNGIAEIRMCRSATPYICPPRLQAGRVRVEVLGPKGRRPRFRLPTRTRTERGGSRCASTCRIVKNKGWPEGTRVSA
jgi:hypothetical protein